MMLELRNVNTVYGEMPVLNNVTLQVRRGETVCILGANGAGKTTLLKTILGLVKPVTGSVHFLGERIDGLPIHHGNELILIFPIGINPLTSTRSWYT